MKFERLLIVALMALPVACSTTHTVDAEFPTPLVAAIPRTVHLSLDDSFRNHTFVQEEKDRGDMTVLIGAAQSKMFEAVVGALFTKQTDSAQSADIIIIPALEAFQYALPKETGSDFYEVWLKYRLQAVDSQDQKIADWLISGYGRASKERFQSQGAGINEASVEALRDIGTQLAIGMATQENIRNWLESGSVE